MVPLAARRTIAESAISDSSTGAASPALAGELTVRVWSKTDGGKRDLKVGEPGALPLLAGEQVRLEATAQPAGLCVLCSGSTGRGTSACSILAQDRKFGSQPSGESARETVHSPEALDERHQDERPRRAGDGAAAGPPHAAAPGHGSGGADRPPAPVAACAASWSSRREACDEGQPIEALRVAIHRGIDESRPTRSTTRSCN